MVILLWSSLLELGNDICSMPNIMVIFTWFSCLELDSDISSILHAIVKTVVVWIPDCSLWNCVLSFTRVSAVTGTTDCGLLEGVLHGQGTGLFPAHCVQEVGPPRTLPQPTPPPPPPSIMTVSRTSSRIQGRRESMHKHFATAPRLKKQWVIHHRCIKNIRD